jgi:hypothetical protein
VCSKGESANITLRTNILALCGSTILIGVTASPILPLAVSVIDVLGRIQAVGYAHILYIPTSRTLTLESR